MLARSSHRLLAPQWTPTKEGYLAFLVESKAVYDEMESLMASGSNPMCASPCPVSPRPPHSPLQSLLS